MKFKRILILVLAFCLLGSVTVFANDAFEWFKGKPVRVKVNGETVKGNGLLLNIDNESKTMLPLREIASTLQAMVKWDGDTQTVNIYKPNVHIALTTPQNKDGSYGIFGTIYYKEKNNFSLFVQTDSLTTNIEAMKIEIVDPYGDNVHKIEVGKKGLENVKETMKAAKSPADTLWFTTPIISLEPKYLGAYKVRISMKPDEKSEFFLVSEKTFNSIQR